MAFVLSRHAQEEMARWGISAGLLDEVLQNPQQVVAERGGNKASQSQVDPGVVITVYKTSKIAKCWSTP